MKSFDTNVAVRLLIEDDPAQCERAERAFRQAVAEGGAFFSATVLVELAWVLRVACKQDRAAIAAALLLPPAGAMAADLVSYRDLLARPHDAADAHIA